MTDGGPDARRYRRRTVLARGAAVAATAVAGCLGSGGGPSGASPSEPSTPAGTPIDAHPAAANIADQPQLGPDPSTAEGVIIAFEDPSCPRCRAFERNTVPQIESELVETGTATYVFRGYPVIYPWGEPATHALEATFARDAEAFWALVAHYFDAQSEFSTDNVLERTREFLAAETDVDAGAVVEAVENGDTDPAVEADLDAGMEAGAGRTTPHVFLFRDGRYVTKAAGSVSFSVVKNALGL